MASSLDPAIALRAMATEEEDIFHEAEQEVQNQSNASNLRMRTLKRLIKNEKLDRKLERHHITGIAISGTIGVGLLVNSGENLRLSGSVGVILSYLIAGCIISSVMMCLAEMVSVRPVTGAIFEYPKIYVDEALGYAAGLCYWFTWTFSVPGLVVTCANITHFWPNSEQSIDIGWTIFILVLFVGFPNFFGIRVYGNMGWAFKWFKILLVLGLMILMICVNVGVGKNGYVGGKYFQKHYRFPQGYTFTRLATVDQKADIPGPGGVFLGIWTAATHSVFAYIGVELLVITAGEAKYPRKDLPGAAKRIYRVPLVLYTVAAALVAFNVPYTHPDLYATGDPRPAQSNSPFIIAIKEAGLPILPGFVNACFLIAAWDVASTSIYVASRTLFGLARDSRSTWIKDTIGRTNSGGTPLVAIFISLVPSLLSFFGASKNKNFQKALDVFSNLNTVCVLCVYISHCIAFLRFKKGMKMVEFIDRNTDDYKAKFYKSRAQPVMAYIGIVGCSLLILFNGWDTFAQIARRQLVAKEAAFQLLSAYLGAVLFVLFYLGYKFYYGTRVQVYSNFDTFYQPMRIKGEDLDREHEQQENRFLRFWSWVR